jgi:hypothetical protein
MRPVANESPPPTPSRISSPGRSVACTEPPPAGQAPVHVLGCELPADSFPDAGPAVPYPRVAGVATSIQAADSEVYHRWALVEPTRPHEVGSGRVNRHRSHKRGRHVEMVETGG